MLSGFEECSTDLYYAAKELSASGHEADAIHCFFLSHLARCPEHVIAFESAKDFVNLGSYTYALLATCSTLVSAPKHEAANRWLYTIILLTMLEQSAGRSPIVLDLPDLRLDDEHWHFADHELDKQDGRLTFNELKRKFRTLAGRDSGFRTELIGEVRVRLRPNWSPASRSFIRPGQP